MAKNVWVKDLIKDLNDQHVDVRAGAALALGEIGPAASDAVPALCQALKDHNWWVRAHSAAALGKIGPEARTAVPALTDALKDEDGEVRRSAAEALGPPDGGRGRRPFVGAQREGLCAAALTSVACPPTCQSSREPEGGDSGVG